jgi:drug/metabolite transporter (DMT)-like permease
LLSAALALASSVAWGSADFLAGLISRRRAVMSVLFLSQAAGLVVIGAIVLIRGEAVVGDRLWLAALGAIAGAVALGCFYRGLAIGAMGVVAPISAGAAVIPVAVGVAAGERPEAIQWAGIVLAVGGIALASREPRGADTGEAKVAAGVGLALVAALGFGVFLTLMNRAAEPDPLLATLVSRAASVAVLALAVAVVRPDLRLGRRDGGAVAAVGVLDISANALYAVASTIGLLSVTAVLGSLYAVVPVVLAWLLLHERIHPLQRVGSAAAIAGAVLLAAGGPTG